MKKLNLIRIASSVFSALAVLIILFCPILKTYKRNYNFFSLIFSEHGDMKDITLMIVLFCASISLIAFIAAIAGTNKKSKVLSIILNGIGLHTVLLIPLFYIAVNWFENKEYSLIGVGVCAYILITLISIILLAVSDMVIDNKDKEE